MWLVVDDVTCERQYEQGKSNVPGKRYFNNAIRHTTIFLKYERAISNKDKNLKDDQYFPMEFKTAIEYTGEFFK